MSDHDDHEHEKPTPVFPIIGGIFILAMAIIYGVFLTYEEDAQAGGDVQIYYNYFRDISIMIFFGFGFLMTFVRRGSFSAIGFTMLASVMAITISIPLEALFEGDPEEKAENGKYKFGVLHMVHGLFCAASVMISYGAVLGRITPLQMLLLGIIEPCMYWLNLWIGEKVIQTVDIGGGIFIHTFGCYFGLAMSFFIANTNKSSHPDERSSFSSDTFAFAGTLFLWIMWPSFNAAIASPDGQNRAIINTFISLTGSTIATFVTSHLCHHGKFDPVFIQNSTLAGGVAMGVVADVRMEPTSALIVGTIAGIVSVCGYHFLTPKVYQSIGIQDVCGIHNLHGMPGLIGSFLSVLTTYMLVDLPYPHADKQPIYQLAAIGVTLVIAIIGGLATGFFLKLTTHFQSLTFDELFNDKKFWVIPSDYDHVATDEEPEQAEEHSDEEQH
eukprot:TRINITY_DN17841_c0_g1_i1.p1 TRINITY_DN17841_c0_g1~~TRINITY_DN17841_c0_g1_i1.p1  ORF type:complete len:441 (+),score=90.10 TRINITY_DN17841_c0_g1_i1:106-1428(+)